MEWKDYEKLMPKRGAEFQLRTQVDVKCPKCWKKIWRRNDLIFGSYPAIYKYKFLQVALIVLKLCKVIDWSWWVVLIPTWISIVYTIVVILVISRL